MIFFFSAFIAMEKAFPTLTVIKYWFCTEASSGLLGENIKKRLTKSVATDKISHGLTDEISREPTDEVSHD